MWCFCCRNQPNLCLSYIPEVPPHQPKRRRSRKSKRTSEGNSYEMQALRRHEVVTEPVTTPPRRGVSIACWPETNESASGAGRPVRKTDIAPAVPSTSTGTQTSPNPQAGGSQEANRYRQPRRSNVEVVTVQPTSKRTQVKFETPLRADKSVLNAIKKDVIIIPAPRLEEFLPAGVPRPFSGGGPSNFTVIEMDAPNQVIMMHLMTEFSPIEPELENGQNQGYVLQKAAATDLMNDMARTRASFEGILLSRTETQAYFPIISMFIVKKTQQDPNEFFQLLRHLTWDKYNPRRLRYTARHVLDMFDEVATIARPPVSHSSRLPATDTTGYIVIVYKVFDGDDGSRFEQNWIYWTGARLLYYGLPASTGMRRITLHKSLSPGDMYFVLVCECSNFMEKFLDMASLVPALRSRLCGCVGLYRISALF